MNNIIRSTSFLVVFPLIVIAFLLAFSPMNSLAAPDKAKGQSVSIEI